MNEAGTLERVLLLVGEALESLSEKLRPEVFEDTLAEFGILLPDAVLAGSLAESLTSAEVAAKRIARALGPLREAMQDAGGSNATTLIAAGAAVAAEIAATASALKALAAAFQQAATGVAAADTRERLEAFAAELPRRILGRLIFEALDRTSVQIVPLLAIAGLAEDRMEAGVHGDPNRRSHYQRRIHFDRIGTLISDPLAHLRESFGWGTPEFDPIALLERIKWWFASRGERTYWLGDEDLDPPSNAGLDLGWFRLQAEKSQIPPGLAAEANVALDASIDREIPLGSSAWTAYVVSQSAFDAGLRAVLWPNGRLQVSPIGGPTISARMGLRFEKQGGEPTVLLGLSGGTRLEASKIDVSLAIEGLETKPLLEAKIEKLNFVLDLGDGDSFLQSIAGGGRGRSDVNVGASWSPTTGLKFTGGAGLEIAIPVHARIGPASLDTIHLVSRVENRTIVLELSAAVLGELGPFKAAVERVGAEFRGTFPEAGGNLGLMQLDCRFKPPSGVGMSIDARAVVGGGFLSFDAQRGEYAGMLQLELAETIAVKAVGLLSTRLPDGSKGYSLLILISAEGFAPIQLGFGFTLTGIGGLLGVNRSVMVEVLRAGLKTGTLGSLLFPADPIRNAAQIVSDLRAVFPPVNRRYLLGPMLQLAWGTPTLLTLELAVLLELPDPVRLVILGRLQALLPNAQHALVQVRMDAIGVIDFNRSDVALDATLYDSRILQFALTGDMALRANWGAQPNFVLAVGGLHPRFAAPPGLPKLSRLALSLSDGDSLRLRCAAYLALTSNTVQFGARLDLHAAGGGFSFNGMLGFDALFQLAPLAFIVDVGAALALRYRGHLLVGIRFEGSLAGPTPWHVQGKATIKIFFFKVSVRFDRQFGQRQPPPLPAPIDALGLLIEALRDRRNWSAALPRG